MTDLAALVLAAGAGHRLAPLTNLRPKPLCPVGSTTLLDLALTRVGGLVAPQDTAVNAHHLAEQIVDHVGDRYHLSVEQPEALGTAGAVGAIAGWLAGRDVLIANGDAFLDPAPDLRSFRSDWDGARPRLLVVPDRDRPDFGDQWRFAGVSLLPGVIASGIPASPAGLYESIWRDLDLDLVPTDVTFIDCGDPASYLAANLATSGGASVIGPGAVVLGAIERCVVWPGASVHPGERLSDCIRARNVDGTDLTVSAHDLPSPA